MIFIDVFMVFLLAHILSDFYFQTERMALKKSKKVKYVFIHGLIYGITSWLIIKFILPNTVQEVLWTMVISHFLVDLAKYFLTQTSWAKGFNRYLFVIDQVVHLFILVAISYFVVTNECYVKYNASILKIFDVIGILFSETIKLIVQLLLIHKPANILIANIAQAYKPADKGKEKDDAKKTGRIIGTLERAIMFIFFSLKQYSSVGLVLTAKSIARYNKISEDKDFAEYYLLGTLLSVICVLFISII